MVVHKKEPFTTIPIERYTETFYRAFLYEWQPFLPQEKMRIYAFQLLVRPFHGDVLDAMQTLFSSFKFKDKTRQQSFILRPSNIQIDRGKSNSQEMLRSKSKSQVVLRFDIVLDPIQWFPLPVNLSYVYGTWVVSGFVDECTSCMKVSTTIVSFPYTRKPCFYI